MGFRRTIREPVLWDWATHSLSNYRCRRERHALWSRVGRVRFLLSLDTIDFDAQGGGGEMTLHGMGKPSPPQAGHFPENHHTWSLPWGTNLSDSFFIIDSKILRTVE